VPSHHGHVIVCAEPPSRETMRPVPRQGGQALVSLSAAAASSAIGAEATGHNGLVTADGRFAPSPTGTLHVGNLRTALLAWLFARSQDARFLVRMEDLDTGRIRERFYDEQLRDLAALGLDWDGPVVRQSERIALYEDALASLRAQGLVYACWCTRAEIREAASAPHGDLPEGAYPGTCLRLTAGQRAEREASGRPPALRVRAGAARVAFDDRLVGRFEGVVDDFVVRRNDGAFAYNLAVVVDDAAQGVREVVRGADLLDSTPRQLWLGARLGVPAPRHAHAPLLLGPDGARLAKRHGAVTLADRAALGQSADDVRDELAASLHLCARGERLTPAELVERFSVADLLEAA
jgi:glutamyl-tRNA synthetase